MFFEVRSSPQQSHLESPERTTAIQERYRRRLVRCDRPDRLIAPFHCLFFILLFLSSSHAFLPIFQRDVCPIGADRKGVFLLVDGSGREVFIGGWLGACKVCLTGLAGCKGAVKCSEARWRGSGYRGKGTFGRSWHRELAHTPQHMNTHGQTNTNGERADKITTRYFSR